VNWATRETARSVPFRTRDDVETDDPVASHKRRSAAPAHDLHHQVGFLPRFDWLEELLFT